MGSGSSVKKDAPTPEPVKSASIPARPPRANNKKPDPRDLAIVGKVRRDQEKQSKIIPSYDHTKDLDHQVKNNHKGNQNIHSDNSWRRDLESPTENWSDDLENQQDWVRKPPEVSLEDNLDLQIDEIVENTKPQKTKFDKRTKVKPVGSKISTTVNDVELHSPKIEKPKKQQKESLSNKLNIKFKKMEAKPLEKEPEKEMDGFDIAKFKKANSKTNGIQRYNSIGIANVPDSTLLWRLGLASPEGFSFTTATRLTDPKDHLKPPSYDLTEEQLMANIEKEYADCGSAI